MSGGGPNRKKVLLMGKSGSGKTSMRSIIFANYLARDTQRLNPTLDVQHSNVRFLGSLVLNLWDCGGQDAFYEAYLESRREDVFRNAAVLLYVMDATAGLPASASAPAAGAAAVVDASGGGAGAAFSTGVGPSAAAASPSASAAAASAAAAPSRAAVAAASSASAASASSPASSGPASAASSSREAFEKDLAYYDGSVAALAEFSPGARVVILVHKMDLVPPAERAAVFAAREALLRARTPASLRPQFFATSIWDETLYQAWSAVVHSLVPNIAVLDAALSDLAEGAGADEVVLFERASFLVISTHARARHADRHRFEKVSNLVKRFKLTCGKGQGQLVGMACGNGAFRAVLDAFTSHTYVLVVVGIGGGVAAEKGQAPRLVPEEATLLNIALARGTFERLITDFT